MFSRILSNLLSNASFWDAQRYSRDTCQKPMRINRRMDSNETMTEAEIDELFERTQPIGNAINALAQAELAVATVEELPPDVAARLDQMLAVVADATQRDR